MNGTGSIESQWLAQLAAMRQAIADLNLTKNPASDQLAYGSDLDLDLDGHSSSAGTIDDVWDLISSDDESTSDDLDAFDDLPSPPTSSEQYDLPWLQQRCQLLAFQKGGME
ncbi:hypothetical protein COL922a_014464, partial [Colletotrichum nupharicola]